MRRIAPTLRQAVTDLGIEGFLIIIGIAGLAIWADGPHELDALLVLAVAAIGVGLLMTRPLKA